jgi:hypothetical protein
MVISNGKLQIRNGEVWYNYYWHARLGTPMAGWLIHMAQDPSNDS